MGGVEPWLMARWKARVMGELFSLALTIEALQGKMCEDSLLSRGGRLVRNQDFRGNWSYLRNIFFAFYKTKTHFAM